MPVRSAGILLYRRDADAVRLLLVHPGGPFWRGRDEGAWMIPKGLIEAGEAPLAAALREFEEELGVKPEGEPRPLCEIRQSGGKWVEAFALEGDFDPAELRSNEFTIEYPPKSGGLRAFPEVDEARWFTLDEARVRILKSQAPIIDALEQSLTARCASNGGPLHDSCEAWGGKAPPLQGRGWGGECGAECSLTSVRRADSLHPIPSPEGEGPTPSD